MKKLIRLALVLISCVAFATSICHASDISVTFNKKPIEFEVAPQIIDERTMVPLRAIFETLGAKVDWNDQTKTVTSTKNNTTVKITIGSNILNKNGTKIELDVPAQIVDGFTLVPVRAISEAFGCKVDWDDKTKTVIITYEEGIRIIKEFFSVDTADAENDETYGFYGAAANLTCVPDPHSPENNVYFVDATVTEKISFTYIRVSAEFEPGCEYLVEYDVMMGTDALGNKVKNPVIGTCFRYADPGTTNAKDHGIGSTKVSSDGWTHVKQVHKVPEGFVSSYGGNFGIYGQPAVVDGVSYQVAVDFYVDNIKIVPLNVDTEKKDTIEYLKAGDVIYFEGSTTKSPLEYKAGETMTFKLCIKKGSSAVVAPYIYYTCVGDDGKTSSGYAAISEDGYYYFDTKCEKDGFVRVTAKICDSQQKILGGYQIFEGGAGADIDKIKIDTSESDDYLKFWDKLKKTAFGLKNEVLYESDNISTDSNYIAKDIRLKTADGAGDYASFIYSYPKNATKGSLKLQMRFQGYGVNSASAAYQDGYIIVSVCAQDMPNLQSSSFYSNLQNTKYKSYGMSEVENAKPETSYWWKMFVRNMQIFNYFKKHELFNGKDVEFVGSSQGAFQAINMAAHCGMATYCNVTVPWFANIYGPVVSDRMAGWSPTPVDGLRYFDTAVAAKYLKCKTDIVAGLGDYTCPPSGIMAMYNNMKKCEKTLTFRQNMTHSYQPPFFSKYTLSSK